MPRDPREPESIEVVSRHQLLVVPPSVVCGPVAASQTLRLCVILPGSQPRLPSSGEWGGPSPMRQKAETV